MKALANAVIDAVAFLEMCEASTLDEDVAVEAKETITANFRDCGREETEALEAVIRERLTAEQLSLVTRPPEERQRMIEFYEKLQESLSN